VLRSAARTIPADILNPWLCTSQNDYWPADGIVDRRLLQAIFDDTRPLGVVQDRIDAPPSVDIRSVREAASRLSDSIGEI
jgi:hypothetical protein